MRASPECCSQPVASGGAFAAELLIFLIPFLQCVQLKIVGLLYGSDLLFVAVFAYLVFNGELRLPTHESRLFVFFSSLWLASQIVTDVVRRSAPEDFARGWIRILLTIVNFLVLMALLYGRPRRLLIYGTGLAAGSLGTFLVNPLPFADEYPWKFGVSYGITLAVFLFASRRSCVGSRAILMSFAIGVLNICLGARSRGGACLAVAAYLAAGAAWRRRGAPAIQFNLKRFVTYLAAVGVGIALTAWVYQYSAEAGFLGESAKAEYESQSSGQYGFLLGGRSAVLGSFPAIYDSPILGHGSWAKDPQYILMQLEALAALGYSTVSSVLAEEMQTGYIPAHSHLFGSWVEAGLLGAFFWAWVLAMVAKTLGQLSPARFTFAPVAAFTAFALAWDIVFSPYGADMRFVAPYSIVMLMTCVTAIPKARNLGNDLASLPGA